MWYSKADGGKIKQHTAKMWAVSRLNIHAGCGEAVSDLGLYSKDPEKHPDAENLLPAEIAKQQTKRIAQQIRGMLKGGRE